MKIGQQSRRGEEGARETIEIRTGEMRRRPKRRRGEEQRGEEEKSKEKKRGEDRQKIVEDGERREVEEVR